MKTWLFMIMAMAMPLQFYSVRFMGLNWSLDRILLMVLLFLMFFRYSSQFRNNLIFNKSENYTGDINTYRSRIYESSRFSNELFELEIKV